MEIGEAWALTRATTGYIPARAATRRRHIISSTLLEPAFWLDGANVATDLRHADRAAGERLGCKSSMGSFGGEERHSDADRARAMLDVEIDAGGEKRGTATQREQMLIISYWIFCADYNGAVPKTHQHSCEECFKLPNPASCFKPISRQTGQTWQLF